MRQLFALIAILLFAPPASWAQSNAPMTFHADLSLANRMYSNDVAATGLPVYADGVINDGTTERLLAYLKINKIEEARIYFNSPGGSLLEGMKLGRAIRQSKLFTTIGVDGSEAANKASICASACAYAFAGGVSRFLDETTGRLGLHQFYSSSGSGASEGDTQLIGGLLAAYLNEMGVDARAFALASVTAHEGILWLTTDEAVNLQFANNGIQPTKAEIKINGMIPYLRLEQDRYNVTTRYIFLCYQGRMEVDAGVVTDPENSAMHALNVTKAYLELDGVETLDQAGPAAAIADQSVVWLRRPLLPITALSFLRAKVADIWVENGGAFRWGGSIDLLPVREQMRNYFQQCYK
ncbi:hypothetical protein HZF05_14555 [Sphingomonas sp. CGMCC 1.13654]|uniref:Uncharacterized protein n=1 Tax=Sphingomonas chungangi TaxID=2683589 RepID=A0A838LAY6_9SPHN|nr:hypothetical protein [Sphingomonas chungangi]MBA2935306.1 hypothetical protein [Sphingomonas chungangi]MVW56813.1 hypothetical protein [Sphingomonas chungangi]